MTTPAQLIASLPHKPLPKARNRTALPSIPFQAKLSLSSRHLNDPKPGHGALSCNAALPSSLLQTDQTAPPH